MTARKPLVMASGQVQELQAADTVSATVISNGANAFGYGTGAGGAVTQATSKYTAVTINKPSGVITTSASELSASAIAVFQLNNDQIALPDTVLVTFVDGNGLNYNVWSYAINVGNCQIALRNITGSALSHALPIRFTVIKGASS